MEAEKEVSINKKENKQTGRKGSVGVSLAGEESRNAGKKDE